MLEFIITTAILVSAVMYCEMGTPCVILAVVGAALLCLISHSLALLLFFLILFGIAFGLIIHAVVTNSNTSYY